MPTQVAFNPDTGEALRLEGESWVKTEVAKHEETGAYAIWDGEAWKDQDQPDKSGVFSESMVQRVPAGIASATGQTLAGLGYMAEKTGGGALFGPAGVAATKIAEALGVPTPAQTLTDLGRGISENAAKDYGLDPAKDTLFSSKLIGAATSIVPAIASGPAAPATIAAMMGESGRAEAEKAGGSEAQQAVSFAGNAAVGLITEAFLGVPAVLRAAQSAKIPEMTVKAIVGQVAKQVATGAIREGSQEALQQVSSNLIASHIAQYEKDRSILQGVGEAFVLGGLVGGPVGGATYSANLPEAIKSAKEAISGVSDTSLKAALSDEALLEGSPYSRRLIEEELLTRDPGYKVEEAGAPLTAEALRTPAPRTKPYQEEIDARLQEIEDELGAREAFDPKDGKAYQQRILTTEEDRLLKARESAEPMPMNEKLSRLAGARNKMLVEGASANDPRIRQIDALIAKTISENPVIITGEPTQQPYSKGGDKNESTTVLPNSEGTVENRDEQRQGQRQGDDGDSQGLRPDEGNSTSDSARPQERQDVEGGQRDQLAPTPQTEPAPATESKGAESQVPEVEDVTYQGESKGQHNFKDEVSQNNFVVSGEPTVEAIKAKQLAARERVSGPTATTPEERQKILDEGAPTTEFKKQREDERAAKIAKKKSDAEKLKAMMELATGKPAAAPETPVEAPKQSKQEIVLQAQLKELQGDYDEARAFGEKKKARDLKDQIMAKKEAISKEKVKSATEPASRTKNAPDFTQATQEPSAELTKEADETGTEFYSGIPLPKFKIRKFTPLDKATASRSAKLQKSEQEATAAVKEIRKVARTEAEQNAITLYVEAGGDHSKLSKWHLAAKNKGFKKAALDAMRLTSEQEALADKIIKTFETLGARGQLHGVLKSFRENYVPHVWDLGKKPSGSSGSALQQNFRHAKARTFATIAEGDAAGFTPKTLEIGKILPAYMAEMNKVIADRQFVHELARGTASDGRPLVVPRGVVKTLETDDGTSYLVNPRTPTKVKDAEGEAIETHDYRTMENQPALAGWKWKGKDEDGNPIFLRADLALHPDAYRRVTAMLGKSAIREWASSPSSDSASPIPKALVRGLDSSQAVIKREMFSLLAPFHQVQEGTHAIGHLINPFFGLKEANLSDPAVMDAAAHGLMLQQDRGASQQYMEGIGGERSFTSRALGKLGAPGRFVAQEIIDGYQDYLFKSYIPRLKYTTYEAILKRNSKRYAGELKSGEVTAGDIKLLSAEQTNAAYGHLNYALLDRNPTLQHLFQLGALAPDFLEARARFVGQAAKGLSGSKVGSEQFKAVVVLALAQAGIAYTLANLTGGEWDKDHPFEMRRKGRTYTMRSVPEDLMLLGTQLHDYGAGKTQGVPFVSARINPTVQTLEQLRTGLNFRGEKTDLKTTLGEYLAKYIPITARALPGVRELTETSRNSPISPIQQLAGSFGLKISRYSPITDAYEMANKWKKENGIEEKQGTYPVSKYQPLRYALEDGDLEKAREKWDELRKKHSGHEIAKGFKASVTHAFTGSRDNDRKLQQSLKPEDRAIFDEALRARQRILRSYVRMLESGS